MGPALPLLLAVLLAVPGAPGRGEGRARRPPASDARRHARAAPPAKPAHQPARGTSAKTAAGSSAGARAKATARPASKATGASTPAGSSDRSGARLAAAQADLRSLMRDPQKRRYRHHWERAIRGLLRAARGRDAPAATLEAARARYALYRWSADEADREKALILAGRATRLGAPEAAAFAAAVRREAGDDRPSLAPIVARAAPRLGPAVPAVPTEDGEEAPPDPQLEAAVADLSHPGPAMALGESGGAGPATVSGVRAWSSDDYTRVAIYLDHWVGWQKLELPAQDGSPRRLALDFRPARLGGAASASDVAGDQVDRVRRAQRDPETVRVVLDLHGDDAVHFYGLDDPPRLVVDVGTRAAIREARAAAAGRERPAPRGAGEGEVRPVRRVVVDAGHGGHDPGAIGPTRVREKDVTLAMARRLARRLRADGFEVVLTRDRDRFLALEERTAIANARRGDLFVSLHANANPRRSSSGVGTWVLNVASDRYAARLAARENGADLPGEGEGTEAQRILTDLDAKAATDASHQLARLVQREVTERVRASYGDVRDLGVRSALFYVLLGARMPAVLVETAHISNRREEKRLASPRYQEEVAAAVARAVGDFARRDQRLARAGAPAD